MGELYNTKLVGRSLVFSALTVRTSVAKRVCADRQCETLFIGRTIKQWQVCIVQRKKQKESTPLRKYNNVFSRIKVDLRSFSFRLSARRYIGSEQLEFLRKIHTHPYLFIVKVIPCFFWPF